MTPRAAFSTDTLYTPDSLPRFNFYDSRLKRRSKLASNEHGNDFVLGWGAGAFRQ